MSGFPVDPPPWPRPRPGHAAAGGCRARRSPQPGRRPDSHDDGSVTSESAARDLPARPHRGAEDPAAAGRRAGPARDTDDVAEAVLDRLTEVGLIDDAAYARAWVSSRQAGRGLARRALSAELRAKESSDVAAEAVGAVDDEDERAAAQRLVDRRLGAMRRLGSRHRHPPADGDAGPQGYNGGWPPR